MKVGLLALKLIVLSLYQKYSLYFLQMSCVAIQLLSSNKFSRSENQTMKYIWERELKRGFKVSSFDLSVVKLQYEV